MSPPQISVVMPACNSGAYTREPLASALARRGVGLEVPLVADGSSDDTVALVEPFCDRVRLVSQANPGSAVAQNRDTADAWCEFVAFHLQAGSFATAAKLYRLPPSRRRCAHRVRPNYACARWLT